MIDPQLEEVVVPYLQSVQERIVDAAKKGGDRPWVDFAEPPLEAAGKFDFAKLHENFKREASTNDYEARRIQEDVTVAQLQTSKLSVDFLAGCERDWRARTRSRVRSFVHSVALASSLAEDTGPLRRNTIDWLGRIMLEEPDKT